MGADFQGLNLIGIMRRLDPLDDALTVLNKMDEGSPGAMTFVSELIQQNKLLEIATCDNLEIYGTRLYSFWKECCRGDMDTFCLVLKQYREETISKEFILKHLNPLRGEVINVEGSEEAVIKRSYIFNLETTKIELYFEKSEYDAMPDDKKKLLKHNFLWSGKDKCWVSRRKEPNLWHTKNVARELGFTEEERRGERLSYGEQLERQAERAENRADRYEGYAANASGRAEQLQSGLDSFRGDIAFFTQPNINSSGGRAFTNYRDRLYARYHKGFDEYRKSDYFRNKAATARDTAAGEKFKDKGYLDRRIKDCEKEIRTRQKNVVNYEETLYALENGAQKKKYSGEPITIDEVTSWIERELELIEVAMDKQGYLQNCLDELGGIAFNKDNIEVGYIVSIGRRDMVEVVGKGPVNITYKILTGGAAGMTLTAAYAEITQIIKADKRGVEKHPFEVGEKFTAKRFVYDNPNSFSSRTVAVEFEIVKRSDATIQLKEVGTDKKPITRKPVKRFDRDWAFSIDDRHGNTFYKPAATAEKPSVIDTIRAHQQQPLQPKAIVDKIINRTGNER